MQVSNPNNVKIYNLSSGKSLPEWISDRRKRALQNKDPDLRHRVELIQGFDMPTVSNSIQMSRDGQYLFASGVYKPRIRCFDTAQLSMKFERCFDTECVRFLSLNDDYSKLVFLQNDRSVEFHAQYGRYYRIRIPKYGRDMSYHHSSCDLHFVGTSSEIYRFNLELGQFLNPLQTDATEINCCQFNPVHELFACGTHEGKVICFDPRTRTKAGELDCAIQLSNVETETLPSVTCLKFKDGLQMAVGTATGHVLLYDIRSNRPTLVKDHMYGLPIRAVEWHSQDLVLSLDKKILKIWNRNSGQAFTSIQGEHDLNDLCVVPESGLFFMATEAPKMLAYFVPSMGPAPRWCSFLDNITEELEENPEQTVYDDYKFVTRNELESLGLTHLVGSNLLRAFMHGFFMDMRLYHRAKAIVEPFAFERYRKQKVREKIEQQRGNRVLVPKLPKINRDLAEKLHERQLDEKVKKGKKRAAANLLEDSRFAAIFDNPEYQIDPQSEEYLLLNPVMAKMDRERKKKKDQAEMLREQFREVGEDGGSHDDEADDDDDDGTSSDEEDNRILKNDMQKQFQVIRKRREEEREQEDEDGDEDVAARGKSGDKPRQDGAAQPKFFEMKEGMEWNADWRKNKLKAKEKKMALSQRLQRMGERAAEAVRMAPGGSRQMTFKMRGKGKKGRDRVQERIDHIQERKKVTRSARDIERTFKKPNRSFF